MRPYDASRTALFNPERQETVLQPGFRADLPGNTIQLCVEAARLAYLRTEESTAEVDRLTSALALAGFENLALFNHAGTDGQGFGAVTDDLVLLAFRGTQPDRIGDLVSDAHTTLGTWTLGPGHVHQGFANTAQGLWTQVEPWLWSLAHRPARLAICGHSLGAAIASLLAVPSHASHLVTIGSPRVGDQVFVNDLLAKVPAIDRIVDCCDVVTLVPPSLPLLPFRHAAKPVYIDRAGKLQPAATDASMLADQIEARAGYLAAHAFKFGTLITRDLADHAPANYIRAFWP